jgi:hypothetical protein
MTTCAAAHVALANRSRLALTTCGIDQRRRRRCRSSFTALSIIGDASCLEAIGSVHAQITGRRWRTHLADAFHTIVTSERITRDTR